MDLLKACSSAINSCCSSWKYAWLFIGLVLSLNANAQEFTVNAAAGPETCPGNATITLSVQNAAPNTPVNYKVYKLPDTTTPIFNSSGTLVTGLHDGVYYIVATQIVNGLPVEDTTQVTVTDETIPLSFIVESENALCGPDGSIQVTVTSGNAVSYEIITGPVTRAAQASNVFNNLPTGQYSVRVTDNCGTGIVQGEFVDSDANTLTISPPIFPDTELPGCDLITLAHDITPEFPDLPLQTPLQVTITLYPPGNTAPIVYTLTVNGLLDGPDFSQIIPFYPNTPYYYDLQIVDSCGTVYNIPDNLVLQDFLGIGFYGDAGCPGKYIEISLVKYVSPYTVTFNSFPAGFDPMMNPMHPGPFFDPVTGYGSEADDIAVPYGTYNITVTDACGRSDTFTIEVEENEVIPTVSTFTTNCLNSLGGVEIIIPGFEMAEAYITVAPPEYPDPVTDDVSGYINPEFNLEMEGLLPPGYYEALVIDECGRPFPVEFEVNEGTVETINANVRVDCNPGFGTARIFSSGGGVTKVVIIQAPAAFMDPADLPYDVSFNISNEDGIWYMNNLPPGTYKFLVDDSCYTDYELTRTISAYNTSVNELVITRHCGSFDLLLNHTTTSSVFLYFGLQVELEPGVWGNPDNGIAYEGDTPLQTASYQILPNTTYPNLPYIGKFRIVKSFGSYGTGNTDDEYPNQNPCFEVIQDNFDFFDDLQLINIISLTCSGDVADVQVIAQGAEPINYSIVSKNGEPFVIDNGNNNIFTGLESADYVLYFEDPCGNFRTIPFNIADLPSLVTATAPDDIISCDEGNNGTETYDLSLQNPAILDGQDPATFTITYHSGEADAETGTNPLPLNYATGPATIYARVINTANTICHATTSFNIIFRPEPQLDMETSYAMCEGEDVYIFADPGYTSYEWDGLIGDDFIRVSTPGNYTVVVTNEFGCEATETVTVTTSSPPSIASIEIEDWNETGNTITVFTEQSPSQAFFEYSLDGVNYQPGNVFTGLALGPYTVYVRDIYDCGMDEGEVYLLTYPKFFTPNGDGINDFWRIQFSHMEPDMLIYIYDRYGKIVSSFDAQNPGWDGTLNGYRLPATDYWFVVKRQNGKEYKGHFSMMR